MSGPAAPARPPRPPETFGAPERANPDLVEAIAQRVVELLAEQSSEAVSASEIARRFDVCRDWVYAHAVDLGAVRIGNGPRPRLRFYPSKVASYLDACSTGRRTSEPAKPAPEPIRRRRPQRSNGQGAALLPIRGQSGGS